MDKTRILIIGTAGRHYPPAFAGPHYPEGIPIFPEAELKVICRERRVELVVLAYSDFSHVQVMHLASRTLAYWRNSKPPGFLISLHDENGNGDIPLL